MVKLRRTVTQGCLFVLDKKLSEQLHYYNALKFQKPNLSDFFLEWNELSRNLEILDKFQKSMQESLGFSFSMLFADNVS